MYLYLGMPPARASCRERMRLPSTTSQMPSSMKPTACGISRVIPHAVGFIELGICDVVLGSRIRSRQEALAGGMPKYKYISNRFLTAVENLALGQNLGDFHS